MSQRRRFSLRCAILLHISTSVEQLSDTSHAQTGKCTNDYSNNVFFSRGEVNGQLLVQQPLSSPLARSLNDPRNLVLSTIVMDMKSTALASSWRGTWM